MPKNAKNREKDKYYSYEAAYHGCLHCVRFFVQEKGVPPAAGSDTQGYTAADWATWAITLHERGEAPTKSNVHGCRLVLEFPKNLGALASYPEHASLAAVSVAQGASVLCVIGNGLGRPKATPPSS